MTAARRVTHAHREVARKAGAIGALADAEQHIRKVAGATTRDRIAKADRAQAGAAASIVIQARSSRSKYHKAEIRPTFDAGPGSLGVTQHDGDDDLRERASKRQARVKAGLARRGFTLQQLPDSSFLITPPCLSITLDDCYTVERFIAKAECES